MAGRLDTASLSVSLDGLSDKTVRQLVAGIALISKIE